MLPKHVHKVRTPYGEYFYFQEGRGTKAAGPRTPLGKDPHAPEFWKTVREARGTLPAPATQTVNGLIDAFEASMEFTTRLAASSQDKYRASLKIARDAWGGLPAAGVRPVHVRATMAQLRTAGRANNFLIAMYALSKWARRYDHIPASMTEGVESFPIMGGHKPWTQEQIECAHAHLVGPVRRGVMLALYTGQRGSDVVKLGWTSVDGKGFDLGERGQQKTGVRPWCPIVRELANEMATWERRPGPFVLHANGKPFTRKQLDDHFGRARDKIPELVGTTLHGLRATAVIRLRREGLTPLQIQDIVGLSLAMIQRYCRFADKKASGEAVLLHLEQARAVKEGAKLKNTAGKT